MNESLTPKVQTSENTNPYILIIGKDQKLDNPTSTYSSSVEMTINHNLGYVPKFSAYVSNDNVSFKRISSVEETFDGVHFYLYIDSVKANEIELKFRFTIIDTGASGDSLQVPNKYVKYYIFREKMK